jgi:formylmethanofuran dehydrogenase subunit E
MNAMFYEKWFCNRCGQTYYDIISTAVDNRKLCQHCRKNNKNTKEEGRKE